MHESGDSSPSRLLIEDFEVHVRKSRRASLEKPLQVMY